LHRRPTRRTKSRAAAALESSMILNGIESPHRSGTAEGRLTKDESFASGASDERECLPQARATQRVGSLRLTSRRIGARRPGDVVVRRCATRGRQCIVKGDRDHPRRCFCEGKRHDPLRASSSFRASASALATIFWRSLSGAAPASITRFAAGGGTRGVSVLPPKRELRAYIAAPRVAQTLLLCFCSSAAGSFSATRVSDSSGCVRTACVIHRAVLQAVELLVASFGTTKRPRRSHPRKFQRLDEADSASRSASNSNDAAFGGDQRLDRAADRVGLGNCEAEHRVKARAAAARRDDLLRPLLCAALPRL